MCFTITSDVKAREFLEVGVLKALLVSVNRTHHSRPRPPENLQRPTTYTPSIQALLLLEFDC